MDTSLAAATQNLFTQLEIQLGRISQAQYARSLEVLSGSSIGMHIRHILEFYRCLEEQLPTGVVCYDLRRRDPRLEDSPAAALAELRRLSAVVAALPERPLSLRTQHGTAVEVLSTTTGRELFYTYEHAIHHLALVKIALRIAFPEIELIPNFGVAPATQRHRAGQ